MPHAWSLLLMCLSVAAAASQNALQLTDSTFERATQASSGQTTQHWFVAFTCPEHHAAGDLEHFKKSWDALAEESWQEGYGFQVAEVDTCENPSLKERFNIMDTAVFLFRDREMYKYPTLSYQGATTQKALQQFALSGYQQAQAQQVPAPTSFVASMLNELFSSKLGAVPIAVMTLGFVGVMFVFFVYLNQVRVSAVVNQQKRR